MNPSTATDRDRVGPYQLIKAIGAGGSARIDLARIDRAYNFQRHVVIKRPLEHLRSDAKAAASLRREARIGGRLRHPNLVAILDAGVHDGYDYLVLEYVHGGSLRTLMQADSPSRVREVSPGVALAIAGDIARGLHAAHELADEHGAPLGLVHRDVSPGNILVGLDGATKLADFGIAKETRVQTLSGSMHGTVTYMAPEQCRGHAFDRRADVFSLGVILYELVTGTRLFWADNDVASLHKVLSGNVPRPRKLRPSISPALEEIVMTAVAHDQDRRFTSARDLADAIEVYARAAGEVLGARWIAKWAHEILGPREVPWIGSATIPDMTALASEGSLVELIESLQSEAPPDPTFGPTAPQFPDEIDTKPRREPVKQRRVLGIVVAAGLAAGAATTAVVMTRDDGAASSGKSDVAPTEVAPTEVPTNVAPTEVAPSEVAPSEVAPSSIESEPEIEIERDRVRSKSSTRRRHRTTTSKPTTTPEPAGSAAAIVVEEPKKPPAGSGSQKPPKWDPTLLLPTDKKQ